MNKRYYLIIFIALIILNFIFIMMDNPILFIFSFIGLCVYIVYMFIKLFQFLKIRLKNKQADNKNNTQDEKTLKSIFLKPIDSYNYNDYILPKIKQALEDGASRYIVEDGYFIYKGDAVTIKTNIKEYKQFALAFYTKFPVLFHLQENHNYASIETDFRSEITFNCIEKIDSVKITDNALQGIHKGNIINISKNKVNALDCLFVNNIDYGVLINNAYIKFFNKEAGFNIDIINRNPENYYISFNDHTVLRYFYKILNEYDTNITEYITNILKDKYVIENTITQ